SRWRAATATSSFCVDAGARARSVARPYTVTPLSCTTRQLRTPPRAASNRAVRRDAASVATAAVEGGAGEATAGGGVGGGGGSGGTVLSAGMACDGWSSPYFTSRAW